MAILQLALDFADIERALAIAKEAEKSVDWLEAGTPLIKSEGLEAIRRLRKAFPSKPIVADMKIMDTGALEVELAAKAGANIVTVMGAADLSTIREAIAAAKKYGVKVVVDLMNIDGKRISEIENLAPDYICPHIGIDQQMKGMQAVDFLKRARTHTPLVVAGGITSETAGLFAKAGAEVIVVGGAITKAANPAKAAAEIKKAIESGAKGKASTSSSKKKFELSTLLKSISTPNLSDAMQRKGEMRGLVRISGGKFSGRAVTVRTMDGDWAKTVEEIDEAKAGEVIVVECCGKRKAVWGGLATQSALQKKLAGAIIDGPVRDVDEIRKMKFPLFARSVSPTAGEPKGFGETNTEIECGGAKVKPGDLIVADESGVVVVPAEREQEILNRARDVQEREGRIREEIRRGSTLSKVLKLKRWELRYE